jgi:hypothetical protein
MAIKTEKLAEETYKKLVDLQTEINGLVNTIGTAHLQIRGLNEELKNVTLSLSGVEKTFAIVNSKNEKAMNFDTKLGFKEEIRFDGLHDNGGDIVILTMNKTDCKWIRELKHAA